VSESDELLDTRKAAAYLGLAAVTLRQWRWRDAPGQPPFLRVGTRAIRYRRRALADWAIARESQSQDRRQKSHGSDGRATRRTRGDR
jgi:hypothetical protein